MKRVWIIFLILVFVGFGSSEFLPADRLVDWDPGIPGGIPERSVICATLFPSGGDDSVAIQNAINTCPVNQTVFFSEGNYLITRVINVGKGIVLRGAGSDKTKLVFDPPSGIKIGINVGSSSFDDYLKINSGYTKGSNTINVDRANNLFQVGNYLVIDQENNNDTTVVTSSGDQGDCTWCGNSRCSLNHSNKCDLWVKYSSCGGVEDDPSTPSIDETVIGPDGVCEGGQRAVGQIIKIKSIDGLGNIIFEPELYWNYNASSEPQALKIKSMVEYFGIEDMNITQVAREVKYYIQLQGCAYCWVKDMEFAKSYMRDVEGLYLYKNEIRDNYFHHSFCYTGDNGYAYSLWRYPTDNLIENNILHSLHDSTVDGGGGGNVIAYNYIVDSQYENTCGVPYNRKPQELISHGAHPVYNLYEGNVLHSFLGDYIWGSSSHIVAFRNRVFGQGEYPVSEINWRVGMKIEKYQRFYSVVGNVIGIPGDPSQYEITGRDCSTYNEVSLYRLGYPGSNNDDCKASLSDSLVNQTLIRHGNFDYVNNSIRWYPGLDHDLPVSLYLDSKPFWFGNVVWPPIDTSHPEEYDIPAKLRFEGVDIGLPHTDFHRADKNQDCNINETEVGMFID